MDIMFKSKPMVEMLKLPPNSQPKRPTKLPPRAPIPSLQYKINPLNLE